MATTPLACPHCGSKSLQAYLYGYPSPLDQIRVDAGEMIVAGPLPDAGCVTHRCADCNYSWDVNGEPQGSNLLPSQCDACGERLTSGDLLRYTIAANERRQDEPTHRDGLRDDVPLFAAHPVPVCHACREEIVRRGVEVEYERIDVQRLSDRTSRAFRWSVVLLALVAVLLRWMFASW